MNISKNNEINNINKIDPWEYNHFLEDMKKRAAKKAAALEPMEALRTD